MKRRDFLKSSALIGSAAVLGAPFNSHATPEKATIQKYKEIGKIGLKMSDISFERDKLSSASLKPKPMSAFTCTDSSSEKACPYGLPVASILKKVHKQLSFSG